MNISSPAIDQLAWVTQVQWNVEQAEILPESLADVMKAAVAAEISKAEAVRVAAPRLVVHRAAPAAKTVQVKKKTIQAIQVARATVAVPVAASPKALPTYEERIGEIKSAMDREYFGETRAVAVDAYFALRSQFQVALNIQDAVPQAPAEQLAIQTAPERSDALAVLAASAIARVEFLEANPPAIKSSKQISKQSTKRKRVRSVNLPQAPAQTAAPALRAAPSAVEYPISQKPVAQVRVAPVPTEVARVPVDTQTLTENIRDLKVVRPAEAAAVEAPLVPQSGLVDLEQVFPTREIQPVAAPAPAPRPVQTLPKPSAFKPADRGFLAAAPVTTQASAKPAPVVTTHSVPVKPDYSGSQGLVEAPKDTTVSSLASSLRENDSPFFEAMDVASPVQGVSSSILSYEGHANSNQARWMTSEAPGYLPTLALRKVEAHGTPMLSHTGLHWMGLEAKVKQQKEAGVVYVKLAPHWDLKLSARAEGTVSLDGEGHIQAEQKGDEQFAVYLNVEPGGHLVHLTRSEANSEKRFSGSVGIPVLPGTMTFLDLSAIEVKTVTGMVLDAGAGKQARPVGNAHVSTADRTKTAFTSADGRFVLENVVTVGAHPVVLESDDASSGFTHRYQLDKSSLKGAFLFRFGAQQCQDWIGQLEGGISPKSGLLVAAVPEVLKAQPDLRAFPSTAPMFANSTLGAETYTLSAGGFLKPKTELSNDSARYVSVQLSDGFHLTQLKTPEGQIVWSSLVRVSPDVISVVRSR